MQLLSRALLIAAFSVFSSLAFAAKGACPDAIRAQEMADENARDSALMLIVQTGSAREAERAFGELYSFYYLRIVGGLRNKLQNGHDAEDMAQIAFTKAWTRRDQFKPGTSFAAWLNTIAFNSARDMQRAKAARKDVDAARYVREHDDGSPVEPDVLDTQEPTVIEFADFPRSADGSHFLPLDENILTLLSPRERQVFELRFAGSTYREISEKLNITVTNVGFHATAARTKIKKLLVMDPSEVADLAAKKLAPAEPVPPREPKIEELADAGIIAKLKPRQQQVVTLRKEGQSYKEIAAATGIPETNIGQLLIVARKKIATLLDERASFEEKFFPLLSPLQQQVYRLSVQGLRNVEIAKQIGKSREEVGSALHAARTKIKAASSEAPSAILAPLGPPEVTATPLTTEYKSFFIDSEGRPPPRFFEDAENPKLMSDLEKLTTLGPLQRDTFVRVMLKGQSYDEAAAETGRTRQGFIDQMVQIKKKLKAAFGDSYEDFVSNLPQLRRYIGMVTLIKTKPLSENFVRGWSSLSAQRREIYQHVLFEGKSYEETAELMHLSPSVVNNGFLNARIDLRTKLGEDYEQFFWLAPELKIACRDSIGLGPPLPLERKAILSLAKLGEVQRDSFYRVVVGGQSIADLARAQGKDSKSVRESTTSAIKLLREDLGPDYETIFAGYNSNP